MSGTSMKWVTSVTPPVAALLGCQHRVTSGERGGGRSLLGGACPSGGARRGRGRSGDGLPGPAVVSVRPSRPRGTAGAGGGDGRGLVVLVGRAGEMPQQHELGLVQIEPRRDQHLTDATPTPHDCSTGTTGATAPPPVDRVMAQQRVQRCARPARHRTDPTTTAGFHGGQQGIAQRLTQQIPADLMLTRMHARG